MEGRKMERKTLFAIGLLCATSLFQITQTFQRQNNTFARDYEQAQRKRWVKQDKAVRQQEAERRTAGQRGFQRQNAVDESQSKRKVQSAKPTYHRQNAVDESQVYSDQVEQPRRRLRRQKTFFRNLNQAAEKHPTL